MTTPAADDELDIDEAAVLRAMDGDKSFPLNTDEIRAVIDRLYEKGLTDRDIADRIGTSPLNVSLWRKRQVMPLSLAAGRGSKTTGPTGSAPRPVPAPPAAATPVAAPVEPTLLIAAAARSESKRTQALGKKLADLVTVVRDRLRDERETAEAKAREAEVREKATAEVAELERKLAAARAKLKKPITDAQRNARQASVAKATAVARTVVHGEFPCDNGCGKVATTKAGQRAHERHCTGGAS